MLANDNGSIVICVMFTFNKKAGKIPGLWRFGGGENRTLVLGKLPTDDYMLIAFKIMGPEEGATQGTHLLLLISNSSLEKLQQRSSHQG